GIRIWHVPEQGARHADVVRRRDLLVAAGVARDRQPEQGRQRRVVDGTAPAVPEEREESRDDVVAVVGVTLDRLDLVGGELESAPAGSESTRTSAPVATSASYVRGVASQNVVRSMARRFLP